MRTKKYSNTEFAELERDRAGNIVDLYSHFLLLKPAQVDRLSDDDHSHYYELQEELDYELEMLRKELSAQQQGSSVVS